MITVTVINRLELGGFIPAKVENTIRDRLTFINPQWEENERRGFSNWQTPKELCYLETHGDRLTIPRGFTRQLVGILKGAGVRYRVEDRRRTLARYLGRTLFPVKQSYYDEISVASRG